MDFNDLKEQVGEQSKELWQKITENESAIQLSEKYKNLSPMIQKALIGFGIFVLLFVLYSIPSSFTSSAASYETAFQSNRDMIRGLFRAARSPVGRSQQDGLSFQNMQSKINGYLIREQVLDKQKGPSQPAGRPLPARMVPKQIKQDGLSIEVKQLNLKQVVAISEMVSGMHPKTKLASVDIIADTKDPHYFNVTYVLSSLSLANKGPKENPNSAFKKRK